MRGIESKRRIKNYPEYLYCTYDRHSVSLPLAVSPCLSVCTRICKWRYLVCNHGNTLWKGFWLIMLAWWWRYKALISPLLVILRTITNTITYKVAFFNDKPNVQLPQHTTTTPTSVYDVATVVVVRFCPGPSSSPCVLPVPCRRRHRGYVYSAGTPAHAVLGIHCCFK